MAMPVLHPDQLKPGDTVGPWLITQVLGRGGSARVFKVERDGQLYSLKVALRPRSHSVEELEEDEYIEETNAWRRVAREAATLFTYASHPNLLRVYGVDFWPSPSAGYPFLVIDYVDGDTWHEWRWRKPPHAAGVVRMFSEVVRTVSTLHARGVYHRDLKAENILIRRADGRPFLIDFGTVRLPGALTQTMGLPEGVLHLSPPELLAYARSKAWARGEPFRGGVTADLYALGALLYQTLTDVHPFDPELPDKDLVAAIATVPPMVPHLLNPPGARVPERHRHEAPGEASRGPLPRHWRAAPSARGGEREGAGVARLEGAALFLRGRGGGAADRGGDRARRRAFRAEASRRKGGFGSWRGGASGAAERREYGPGCSPNAPPGGDTTGVSWPGRFTALHPEAPIPSRCHGLGCARPCLVGSTLHTRAPARAAVVRA